MWLTREEQRTLTILGLVALIGLGVLLWQRQRLPLTIEGPIGQTRAAQWDEQLTAARRVDINTAGVAELERLPNVGPALAGRIVEDREAHGPFETPEALSRVKGIGPRTLEALEGYVTTVRGEDGTNN